MPSATITPASNFAIQLETNDGAGNWHSQLTNDGDTSEVDAGNLQNAQATDKYNGSSITIPLTASNITVSQTIVARKVQSGTPHAQSAGGAFLISGSVYGNGLALSLATFYKTSSSADIAINPATGNPWTPADINNGIGMCVILVEFESGVNQTYGQSTQTFLTVKYTVPAVADGKAFINSQFLLTFP